MRPAAAAPHCPDLAICHPSREVDGPDEWTINGEGGRGRGGEGGSPPFLRRHRHLFFAIPVTLVTTVVSRHPAPIPPAPAMTLINPVAISRGDKGGACAFSHTIGDHGSGGDWQPRQIATVERNNFCKYCEDTARPSQVEKLRRAPEIHFSQPPRKIKSRLCIL